MCDNIQFGILEGQRELRPASEGRRGYRDRQGPWIHCLVLLIRGRGSGAERLADGLVNWAVERRSGELPWLHRSSKMGELLDGSS